jgi:hypothetical protein
MNDAWAEITNSAERAALQAQVDSAKEARSAVLNRILKRCEESESLAKVHGNDYAYGFLLAAVRILCVANS